MNFQVVIPLTLASGKKEFVNALAEFFEVLMHQLANNVPIGYWEDGGPLGQQKWVLHIEIIPVFSPPGLAFVIRGKD